MASSVLSNLRRNKGCLGGLLVPPKVLLEGMMVLAASLARLVVLVVVPLGSRGRSVFVLEREVVEKLGMREGEEGEGLRLRVTLGEVAAREVLR